MITITFTAAGVNLLYTIGLMLKELRLKIRISYKKWKKARIHSQKQEEL